MPDTPATKLNSRQLSTLNPAYQTTSGKETKRLDQVKKYVEMLECDPQARQAVNFFSNLVLNLIGEYSNENEAIEEFVRKALASMEGTWRAAQRWLLKAPVIGYQASEKVLAPLVVGGRNLWAYQALVPIIPESIAQGIKMARAMGQPEEIVQWAGSYNAVHIPGGKCVHWAWDDKGDGYGTPIGRGMLPLYQGKLEASKMWLTGLKRLGEPYFYEVVPDIEVTDENGLPKKLIDVVKEGWAKAAGGSVLLRVGAPGEWEHKGLPKIEVLRADGFDQEFINYVDYVNRAYFLALGIPSLTVMESQFGTRAQSLVHSDVASIGALPVAEEFAESCLMRDIVRPLVDLNYGEQEDYGSFPVTQPTDEQFVSGILTSLAGSGVLGLMVDERVYAKIQSILPDYLPEIEPGQFDQAAPVPEALPPAVPEVPPVVAP